MSGLDSPLGELDSDAAISWIDQQIRNDVFLEDVAAFLLSGRALALLRMAAIHGEGKHDERDVPVPAVPGDDAVC